MIELFESPVGLLAAVVALFVFIAVSRGLVRGMSLIDRLEAAIQAVKDGEFEVDEDFEEASLEIPYLRAWVRSEGTSIKLFQSESDGEVRHTVDMVSSYFHPGLIAHFTDSQAVRAGTLMSQPGIVDHQVRFKAGELLGLVDRAVKKAS